MQNKRKGVFMSKKIKVLYLVTLSDWSGVQKVIYSIAYGLYNYYRNEFEIEVAAGSENGKMFEEFKKLGIKVHIIDSLQRKPSLMKDLRAYFQIKDIIRKGQYDVVHFNTSKVRVLGGRTAKKLHAKKVIYTVHGWWHIEQYRGLKKYFYIILERYASKYCDHLVLLGEKDKEKAKTFKIGKEEQHIIIHNAIIPQEKAGKGLLRKELKLSNDLRIVGNVARLDAQKNPLRFLKIAREISAIKNNVVFVWIGSSVVEEGYEKEINDYFNKNPQLKEKVFFIPFRKDAPILMADFDVFLLTSDSEGMPLVVIEALQQGVPVVSTDVGCVSEVIGKENTGDSVKQLTKLVLNALNSRKNVSYKADINYRKFINSYYDLYKKSSNLG